MCFILESLQTPLIIDFPAFIFVKKISFSLGGTMDFSLSMKGYVCVCVNFLVLAHKVQMREPDNNCSVSWITCMDNMHILLVGL